MYTKVMNNKFWMVPKNDKDVENDYKIAFGQIIY